MIAAAVYIDTGGTYVPGLDFLVKAINEVIRFKINALFLGSEVLTGNQVLRDLNRYGITDAASATADTLTAYAQGAHVNYVLLFLIRPLDVSLDIKAFSGGTGTFLMDQTISRPNETSAMSTVEALSTMVGNQITHLFDLIQANDAAHK